MSRYFRPIIYNESVFPPDAIFLRSSRLWFNSVKVFERDKTPVAISVADLPNDIKSKLSEKQSTILGAEKNPPLVMGVLNLSPDSFSDGFQVHRHNDLLKRINRMINDGVDIIDIGGESTRPGFVTISPDEEINRIGEALNIIRKTNPNMLVSIDTRKALVAEYALNRGARIFNDVSSLNFDVDSMEVAKKFDAYVCLMHNSSSGEDLHKKIIGKDFLLDIFDYLRERVEFVVSKGISRSRIIIDPGIGFGKTGEQNLTILANISLFHTLGCPILVGVSRKKFIGNITGEDNPVDRLIGSVFIAGELIKQGVQVVRVHDIRETRQMIKILDKLYIMD